MQACKSLGKAAADDTVLWLIPQRWLGWKPKAKTQHTWEWKKLLLNPQPLPISWECCFILPTLIAKSSLLTKRESWELPTPGIFRAGRAKTRMTFDLPNHHLNIISTFQISSSQSLLQKWILHFWLKTDIFICTFVIYEVSRNLRWVTQAPTFSFHIHAKLWKNGETICCIILKVEINLKCKFYALWLNYDKSGNNVVPNISFLLGCVVPPRVVLVGVGGSSQGQRLKSLSCCSCYWLWHQLLRWGLSRWTLSEDKFKQ